MKGGYMSTEYMSLSYVKSQVTEAYLRPCQTSVTKVCLCPKIVYGF